MRAKEECRCWRELVLIAHDLVASTFLPHREYIIEKSRGCCAVNGLCGRVEISRKDELAAFARYQLNSLKRNAKIQPHHDTCQYRCQQVFEPTNGILDEVGIDIMAMKDVLYAGARFKQHIAIAQCVLIEFNVFVGLVSSISKIVCFVTWCF